MLHMRFLAPYELPSLEASGITPIVTTPAVDERIHGSGLIVMIPCHSCGKNRRDYTATRISKMLMASYIWCLEYEVACKYGVALMFCFSADT